MNKPNFNVDQMISASNAAKQFGKVRKSAKLLPQAITDNGTIDSVVMDYKYYEELYLRIQELEEQEENRILSERIKRLENNPETAISWSDLKKF